MNPMLTDSRKEKAYDLLTFWAYRLYTGRPIFEQTHHRLSASNTLAEAALLVTKKAANSGINYQINAKQDRNPGYSKPILGGVMKSETLESRAKNIEAVLTEKLTPRQKEIALFLFVPRAILGNPSFTDKQIAKAAGICPKRACEIKFKAIHLVALHVLGPAVVS